MVGVLIGKFILSNGDEIVEDHSQHKMEKEQLVWTCSMHPQIRQSEPGDCPIC